MLTVILFSLLLNNYYLASYTSVRISSKTEAIKDSLLTMSKLDLTFFSQPFGFTDFYMKVKEYYNKDK